MTKVLLHWAGDRWPASLEFKAWDFRIGAHWETYWELPRRVLSVWICPLPCLSICVSVVYGSLV